MPGGHRAAPGSPPFPGAIAVSHLLAYSWPAADGLRGGTPHCHTACTEAYAVVRGEGRVQSLGGDGFRETPLRPGALAWFTPGTIHRLVNDSGDLEIVVLMQNAGLPEAGDMVLTLPDDLLADPERYAAAAALPDHDRTTSGEEEPARARRDLAVEGFLALRSGGAEALDQFHRRAVALVGPKVAEWRAVWASGPVVAVRATGAHLDALAGGDATHLAHSSLHALPPAPAERRFGCCGTLGVHLPA